MEARMDKPFDAQRDNPRPTGNRETHNKPQQTQPPGKGLKGGPGDTERSPEEGTPAERRSGANIDPAARR
jgi:hypothetical protein